MDNTVQAEAVLKMQEYIEAHVFDTVTPGKLSRISGYSPWYASRLFLNFLNLTPAGFDVITLPKADYLMFKGEPFKEENYESAIAEIWEAEKKYDPSIAGFSWDETNPWIQLEPRGERGYIELLPVKRIK